MIFTEYKAVLIKPRVFLIQCVKKYFLTRSNNCCITPVAVAVAVAVLLSCLACWNSSVMEGELGLVRVRVLSPLVRLSEEELEVPASTTVAHLKTIILTRLEGRPPVKVGSFTDLSCSCLVI